MPTFRYICFTLLFFAPAASAEMNHQLFNNIVETALDQYQEEFTQQQQRLSIAAAWHNDNIYASAWKMEDAKGETGLIQISGGFARHPEITPAAFALILCHEIGHHIAGPPRIWKFSAEGQSDYFGASDCLRKLFRRGVLESTRQHIPRVVRHACMQAFTITREQQICARIILAGSTLASYFARKQNLLMPKLARRDKTAVPNTILVPASPQCRLDTYFAAALCNPATQATKNDQPWLCDSPENEHPSNRPRCWLATDGLNHR